MNKRIQDLMQKAESICAETRGVYDEILIKLLIKELEQKKEWVGLTDEEILNEWFSIFAPEPGIGKNVTNGVFEFAKAILKIAQANCNGFCGEIECKENKTGCKRQKTNET